MFNVQSIREDFPILQTQVYGHPLVYLDNGATTQKPRQVVEAMVNQYYTANSNVHRGVHHLSTVATDMLEQSRETVRKFIHAASVDEIVFTRGTTEAVNLVASSFCQQEMQAGDEVIVSTMEHHSNIVPWQLQAERKGIVVKVIPMTDEGVLQMDAYEQLFTEKTKIVSVAHVSNVLGTVNPVAEIIRIAHTHGVPVLIDGAQSVPHMPVDVQALDADFYCFSGHKVYGPTGIGVLYGKREWLDRLPPYQGGGEMIGTVSFEKTTFNHLPYKFEAGTPDYVGATGLAAALDYVSAIGMDNIAAYEASLTQYALEQMAQIPGMRIFGPISASLTSQVDEYSSDNCQLSIVNCQLHRGSVISFLVGDIHHLDMGTLLDRLGIAVRTGHHCAEPLMHRLGIEGTVRASFGIYNTFEEIDAFVSGIKRVASMF
ncbi:MAG: cysteine desulfurase [Bacteroidaceae bacterium]|nr:cysteine desulfurase [Bacteroidaceae bacterium]